MDQIKIGAFLKALRKEKELTQEQLAERFHVSGRTVSRWETGSNMPDLSVLVELADFYRLDIREILDGERKGENMDHEMKDTLEKVAAYADGEKNTLKKNLRKEVSWVLMGFGAFIIVSAMAVLPSDSSWGSVYSILGSIVLSVGVFRILKEHKHRLMAAILCFVLLLGALVTLDYVAVRAAGQVPRFSYLKEYGEDEIVYKAPFCTVVRHYPDTAQEYLEIE